MTCIIYIFSRRGILAIYKDVEKGEFDYLLNQQILTNFSYQIRGLNGYSYTETNYYMAHIRMPYHFSHGHYWWHNPPYPIGPFHGGMAPNIRGYSTLDRQRMAGRI